MIVDIFDRVYFGNSVGAYAIAALTFVVGIGCVWILKKSLLKHMSAWAERTATDIDNFVVRLVRKIAGPLIYFGALFLSLKMLHLTPTVTKILDTSGLALLVVGVALAVNELLAYTIHAYWRRQGGSESRPRSVSGILAILKFISWSMAAVFLLDNLGLKISTVIAGLGIGGIAVGLAA